MVYPCDSYYVTFGGAMAVDDIWQCGLKFAGIPLGGGARADITQGALDQISIEDIFNIVKVWFQSGDAGTSDSSAVGAPAQLAWAKLAVLDQLGAYKFEDKMYAPATPVNPPIASPYPPQITYAVTLWSGGTVGRANYGRFYAPTPGFGSGQYTNGRISEVAAGHMAAAAKKMINDVNGEVSTVGIGTEPTILSRVGTGAAKKVTKIAVGRVLDTQRRRRNSLLEAPVYINA